MSGPHLEVGDDGPMMTGKENFNTKHSPTRNTTSVSSGPRRDALKSAPSWSKSECFSLTLSRSGLGGLQGLEKQI